MKRRSVIINNTSKRIDAETFEEDYRDAKAYHRRAEQFMKKGQHYSVVFNVASMALERYLVALCGLYGVRPENHNYECLMDAVETILAVPEELNKEIRSLDIIFGICSIENYYHGTPQSSDAHRVLSMCQEVGGLFDQSKIVSMRASRKKSEEEDL